MGGRDLIDFPSLARVLLSQAYELVPRWLPYGKKVRHLWHVGDFDGNPGMSANVNMDTGGWGDNGREGDAGKDLLSLYARIRHLTPLEAARELQDSEGITAHQVQTFVAPPPKVRRAAEWSPVHPVPADAPPYRSQWGHYARGKPHAHWEYLDAEGRLLGVVCRFNTSDGGKEVLPLVFCRHATRRPEWKYRAFAEPRPLYGLQRLPPANPDHFTLVIVTEGEKKADALFVALGESVPVLSWSGGCKAVRLADWSPLAGFRVVAWPDADAQRDKATQAMIEREKQPGLGAMRNVQKILADLGAPVRIVDVGEPGTRADGWDAADAVAEGWTREQLFAFMRNFEPVEPSAQQAAPPAAPVALQPAQPGPGPGLELEPALAPLDDLLDQVRAGDGGDGGDGRPTPPPAAPGGDDGPEEPWRDAYHWERGRVVSCVANVMLVLHRHPAWRGVLGFDEFSQRVVKRKPAPFDTRALADDEWSDVDDTRAAAWITRNEEFVVGSCTVAEAANETARANPFHPVLSWLGTLQHDGTPRIDTWLIDYLRVKDSPYTRLVSRFYLLGMCMRVLRPGCKFDTCLVLEGTQGLRKSTALGILGGEWFSDTELDLQNKDSMSNIRGKWLHEFGEMGSLARSESNRQKSFLSRQVDEFRPAYGRREIRNPRQSAFAGSTNEWAWNKDPTGGRRFWPVEVLAAIDTNGLAAARDQLFAEAFALAQRQLDDPASQIGRYWPTGDEQRELFDPEQLARETPDAFVDMLAMWLADERNTHEEFSLATACIEGLHLDAKGMTKDVQTRVGICLKKLNCERVERRTKVPRYGYRRPAPLVEGNDGPGPTDGGVPF